jgi:hypothetical protein
MSRIYKHGHRPSGVTMDEVNSIVDVIETYLCDYKLAVCMIYQKTHLIRLDVYKLGSKSLIASYSMKFKTLSLFHRKKFLGSVSFNDMVKENTSRGYVYEF